MTETQWIAVFIAAVLVFDLVLIAVTRRRRNPLDGKLDEYEASRRK